MTQWQLLLQNLAIPVFLPPRPVTVSPQDARIDRYIKDFLVGGQKSNSQICKHCRITHAVALRRLSALVEAGQVTKEVRTGFGKEGKGNKTNIMYWSLNT